MEILNKIKAGAKTITETGVGLIALAMVFEVLFKDNQYRSWEQ